VTAAGTSEGAPERVVLVGFMGAGKTTVGARLAAILGWDFVDLDREIEARTGRRVAEISDASGEDAFRRLEIQAAREASARRRVVVAAGGGAFAQDETRRLLQTGALTVWLRCALDTLLARIAPDGRRPLARNRATIEPLLAAREAFYRLADVAIDTTDRSVDAVARAVADVVTGPSPSTRRTSAE
jgi:shikimate kinase